MAGESEYIIGAHYPQAVTGTAATVTRVSPQVRAWEVTNLGTVQVHMSIKGTAVATNPPPNCDILLGIVGYSVLIPCDNKPLSLICVTGESSANVMIREIC